MTKLKSIFRRLWAYMNDPRLEKPLTITASILALILVGLIMTLHFRITDSRMNAAVIEQPGIVTAEQTFRPLEASPVPTMEPTPDPTPEATEPPLITLRLTANSVNRDLYVRVLDEHGEPVTGHTFRLDFRFPDGLTYSYDTEEDGSSYYLVQLEPGDYVVSMQPYVGYSQPDPIQCAVRADAQYTPIADIETVAEVKDVSEVSQDEIPEETSSAPVETVPEVIVVSDEDLTEDEVPVLDEKGNQLYIYRFPLGPNGYLLYRGTDVESDVFPVDEDGDEVPEYGLYLVEPEIQTVTVDPEEPTDPEKPEDPENPGDPEEPEDPGDPAWIDTQPYYVSVALYNPDGTPVDTYEYVLVPLTEKVEKKVGWQTIDGKEYFLYEDGSIAVGLKRIGGRLYYFDQFGVKASSVGIDVSFYNEDIDWQAVKAQGIDFAIIRVGGRGWSTGVLYDDSRTMEYLRGAHAAGVKIGVYFYSTAVNPYEAVEEASVALNTVGGISLDFPIFIDLEYSGDYPNGRSDRLSASQRAEIAVAFCETIRNSGYRPGVYAGQNFLKSAINYSAISGYTIWLASYTWDNQLPSFSNRYDIWQFTDRAYVDGMAGSVDMNVIF